MTKHRINTYHLTTRCGYEDPRMFASIPVYLYLTERGGYLRSTPLEELCIWPKYAATVVNIFGTPVMEQLSASSSCFFGRLQYPETFFPF